MVKRLNEAEGQLLNQTQKQELKQQQKYMEEKVLKLTTHNESLIKQRQQSMKIIELEKRNSQFDVDLTRRELVRVETEQKLNKIAKRLRVRKKKDWNCTL